MKKPQTILCDVTACKHHCKTEGGSCRLSQITVSPTKDCKTAHYCKEYEAGTK